MPPELTSLQSSTGSSSLFVDGEQALTESFAIVSTMNWRKFLKGFNRELLKSRLIADYLPEERLDSKWLGYPGATRKEIDALERRLRTTLPPSYGSFLQVSNGWLYPSPAIVKLWSTRRVNWFRKRHPNWIATYRQEGDTDDEILDNDYFDYGPNQMPCNFRSSYLQTALQISDAHDSAVLLLNPKVKTVSGEWEAWFFANWLPGATRYRSFEEMMVDTRRRFQAGS